jgi:hypothetical protein
MPGEVQAIVSAHVRIAIVEGKYVRAVPVVHVLSRPVRDRTETPRGVCDMAITGHGALNLVEIYAHKDRARRPVTDSQARVTLFSHQLSTSQARARLCGWGK